MPQSSRRCRFWERGRSWVQISCYARYRARSVNGRIQTASSPLGMRIPALVYLGGEQHRIVICGRLRFACKILPFSTFQAPASRNSNFGRASASLAGHEEVQGSGNEGLPFLLKGSRGCYEVYGPFKLDTRSTVTICLLRNEPGSGLAHWWPWLGRVFKRYSKPWMPCGSLCFRAGFWLSKGSWRQLGAGRDWKRQHLYGESDSMCSVKVLSNCLGLPKFRTLCSHSVSSYA